MACDCKCNKVCSTFTDFSSWGDDCKNQPSEAPELMGVVNSNDPDDRADTSWRLANKTQLIFINYAQIMGNRLPKPSFTPINPTFPVILSPKSASCDLPE